MNRPCRIIRRETGEDWKEYVTRLMREEGVITAEHEPTDEEVRRFDKKRKNKTVSNEEWVSPSDPDSCRLIRKSAQINELLGSERLTGAALDRLTHRCHILETKGESDRLHDAKRRRRPSG